MKKRQMKTMDGNNAAAYASYAYTDVAAIYPITPSSVMAEVTDEWSSKGKKNIFGREVMVSEMQSEGGAAGAVHGSLSAGALTTTYTASQGLLLMIPNLYKIAGERLPGVFHVSARCIASHALSIFGDHSDVYSCRQTGAAMLCCSSVQEVMDLTPVAHCASIKGRLPFINFFDGFRTSHELQKIEVWDDEDLKSLVDMDAVKDFRDNALNPNHPKLLGSAQNPDVFFQARESCNTAYNDFPAVVKECMNKVNALIGTDYAPFNYYGAKDADRVIVAMGSVCETIEETIDYLSAKGEKVGLIKVRLYRPFDVSSLLEVIPDTCKYLYVMDRTKEPGATGEPLYLDVCAAVRGSKFESINIFAGRYGLASKDTVPAQIIAVYNNKDKKHFTIGIVDDVTHLSLPAGENVVCAPEGTTSCKFWGLGADGTVGANKNSIKIIGDHTDMYAQAYFDYDSKKSGGVTMSHLRFGHSPIKSTYLITRANFVACHCTAYIYKYNMVQELVPGGIFLFNTPWTPEELDEKLPGQVKRYIAENDIQFYTIDAVALGKEIGLGKRINTILQSAFFSLTKLIPEAEVLQLMKDAATKSYAKKGDDVVAMNHKAIDAGATAYHKVEVPASWKDCKDTDIHGKVESGNAELDEFCNKIMIPVNSQRGNEITVSDTMTFSDGHTPSGTAAHEKRGVATEVPVWDAAKCIQCNRCSYVCPHACIRPVVMTEEEAAKAPDGMKMADMTGLSGYKYSMTVSSMDCLGCGSCAEVCPAKEKALTMESFEANVEQQKEFDYAVTLPDKDEALAKFNPGTVKGSQFKQPYLEFSGACAGCGETPYAKLITQLYGDRMFIANATGCSSIWGNSCPSTPYTTNAKGQGPAWSNSLFEDGAEFGYGMFLGYNAVRDRLRQEVSALCDSSNDAGLKTAASAWIDTYGNTLENTKATDELIAALSKVGGSEANAILKEKDYLSKKSQWIFGGDGWAYDIGFGGLDHVIATNTDVNIIVFDTEVYSNTGGQASKATPTGAIAQFAAAGKEVRKKDLAEIGMSYGYVYVAQISMGADYNQCIKAITEAEAYPGPSLIIAYAPCISHGIRKGMSKAMLEEEMAVKSGYWFNFRYNPELAANGKDAFILDSKEPTEDFNEFILGENRYASLKKFNPERADELFGILKKDKEAQYKRLTKLVNLYKAD